MANFGKNQADTSKDSISKTTSEDLQIWMPNYTENFMSTNM